MIFFFGAVLRRRSGPVDLGKWRRVSKPAVGAAETIEYRGWTIRLAERSGGMTVRHKQFTVIVRRALPFSEKYLAGFRAKSDALAAARRVIDEREEESLRKIHAAHDGPSRPRRKP